MIFRIITHAQLIKRLIVLKNAASRYLDLSIIIGVILILGGCSSKNSTEPDGRHKNIPQLIYTKHARCRMECRHINEQEIKDILEQDHINQRKSNDEGKPCPTYAYEGRSHDNQHLRIVIARCESVWKVVTCIDLDNEFECDCK